MVITIVAGYTFLEFLVRKMRDQLREHEPAGMHSPLCLARVDRVAGGNFACFTSNRSRPKSTLHYY
mgnify:CR=1 FL=1